MRFPWANVALLALLIWQTVTGYFGFKEGREAYRWVLWLHGAGAYALVALMGWKASIILDAWRRRRRWSGQRLGFAALLGLLLLTVILGLAWTFYGPLYLAGFSLVSLHIYVAVPLMVLMLWHSWHMRFVLRLRRTWNRRLFLGTAASALAGLAFWRGAAAARSQLALPGASRRFTGSYQQGSFGGSFPVVSWIADDPEPVDLAGWRLSVDGFVRRPRHITYRELLDLVTASGEEVVATLDCTGGWYTEQLWRGIQLERLLAQAGLRPEAASVTITAVSGYQRRASLAEVSPLLLATHVAGAPLSHGHGFPLRLVAPHRRGVEWVKWVTRIHVNNTSKLWQFPLPLQ